MIEGRHARTLDIRTDESNRGLAISPDGTRLVISVSGTHKINVYSLPDGAFLAEFGGKGAAPGRFDNPEKICFSPRNNVNIFVADYGSNRVQVRTLGARMS